ncbi:High_cysteine membrane protein [Hexamita inflata]|uniref:High cysteine membrane protein n=1 Tax=Hexamita inflata TaxID=28002 RepID=A0AA86Q983_9EUKA|nr:High cysteine membrane protein [Hexamita inflata]
MKCPENQITFQIDNGEQTSCGSCDPNNDTVCGLNMICTDSGECISALEYELFNLSCPLPGKGVCGQLTCYNRRCAVCYEGDDNKLLFCQNGVWVSKMENYTYTIILSIVLVCILGIQLICVLKKCCNKRQKKSNAQIQQLKLL